MQTRPVVVFEHVMNERLYRFEVMNGSPFEDALAVLEEFKKSLELAKLESEKAAAEQKTAEESKDIETPKE